MKTSKILLLPVLVTSLLAGCNASGSDEVTLTIWEDESNKTVVEYLANEWVGQYRTTYPLAPKINIKVEKQSEKSAVEKMSTVASSGHGPDIASVTHDTIASAVANKLLAPVSHKLEVLERMTDEAILATSVGEELYGYPITAESMTLMYNKEVVTDVSKIASFEAIKENNLKVGLQLTGEDGGYYTWGLYKDAVLFGQDGKDSSQINLATPQAVSNVYSFYHNYMENIFDYSPEVNLNHVVAGRIAGLIASPFMLASMKNALGDKLGITMLPTINSVSQRPFSGYKAYVISKYSKNGALAQDLANYLTNYESQAYRLLELGYLPATDLDATEDIASIIAEDPKLQVFAESLEDSMVMPNIPQMGNVWRPMNQASTYFKNNAASLTEDSVRATLQEKTEDIKKG